MISRNSISDAYPVKYLGEIVEFLDSKRRPVTESDRRAGPYPYYGANGQQGTIDDYIFDEPLVLLAEDGGHFETPERGIAYRISGKTWVNNHAHVLRPKDGIYLPFLCRVLENYDVTPFITGTTRGKLTKAGASEIVIPVPPLEDQQRIADILDRAEALRAKRRAALDQLDELVKSTFIEMFGDPVKNPKEFDIVQLKSLFSEEKEGTKCGPFGSALKKHEYVESGIPVWTMDNIVENKFIKNGCLFITEEKYQKLKAYSVDEGDILISRAGTVGKMCVVASIDYPSIISTNLIRLSLNTYKVEAIYFTSLMTYFKGKVGRLKTGEDSAYTFMNTGVLKDLEIPLPPFELQRSFAKIVDQVENVKKSHQQSLLELNNLFDSLAHEAFAGKLFSHQLFEQEIENGVKI